MTTFEALLVDKSSLLSGENRTKNEVNSKHTLTIFFKVFSLKHFVVLQVQLLNSFLLT